MRIAVVMPRGSPLDRDRLNSMETVALTLNGLSRHRASTVFVCEGGAATPAAPEMTVFAPAGRGRRGHAAGVLETLRALRPDLVEFHQQLGTAADLARRLAGTPCVLHRHTRIEPPRHLIGRMRHRARLDAFDAIVLVSQAARAEFLADHPRFEARSAVVGNPIDLDAWRGDPGARERLILFSGRATSEKGLDAFCLALAATLDRHPSWRGALMLGDWDRHQAWAEPHVRALERFGDRVEIRRSAPLSAVQAVTRRAAIAVVPSRVAETLGLTALEAHAAGAALISSGRGGLREASGPHAVYADPPEAPALASALERLIRAPDRREILAREAQAFVAHAHAPARRAAELDQLREAVLAKAPLSPRPARA